MIWSWNWFCEQVTSNNGDCSDFDEEDYHGPEIPPAFFLSHLGEEIEEVNQCIPIIKTIPIGTPIYRIRIANQNLTSAAELGAPPVEYAKQANRMSPAGVPMFYGAFDERTAFLETYDPNLRRDSEVINEGTFVNLRDMLLLDLTDLPYPCVFNPDLQDIILPLRFLTEFASDISRPIVRNGTDEPREYVPTQLVTGYIKEDFPYNDRRMDGIIYRSSRNTGQKACVLFLNNEDACDDDASNKEAYTLKLTKVKHKKAGDY